MPKRNGVILTERVARA